MTTAGSACPGCGGPVGADDALCPHCDLPLRAPQRRLVTLLFADLTGYTRLCQDLDPEDVHVTVAPLMSRLRRIAESLGALVEAVQGDGFLAAWGAVHVHRDDVARAVAAVARMQREVTAWRASNPDLQLELPGLHASIHLDEVLVAPARSTTGVSVTGDGVNVGSRLCGVAGEGQVLISAEAISVLDSDVPLGPLEAYVVRGRDRPVEAAEFRWQEHEERRAASTQRSEVPLVDRVALRSALALLADTGGAAVLVGEPGVGKSRLISEVVRDLDKWVVLRAAVPSFGALSWTDPLGDALRTLAPTASLAELRALTPSWDPSPLVERRLLRLLGRAETGSESDSEQALAGAFVEWWDAATLEHPAVLVVDDLHNAPGELLDLLARLAEPGMGHQRLVLATARDETTSWGSLPVVPVVPLPPAEVSELIERLLPGARPDLAEALAARTGGNPLFAVEVAGLLLDRGTVELTDHGVVLVSPDGADDIPTGLRLLVLARLDLLSPGAQAVIRGASVLGTTFAAEALELLLSTFNVVEGLRELEERGMVVRDGARWAFRHALLRDVAYGSMARSQRGRMHVTAAALSSAAQTDPGDASSAHHLHAAWLCTRSSVAPQGDLALAWRAIEEMLAVAEHLCSRRPQAARALLALIDTTIDSLPAQDRRTVQLRSLLLAMEVALTEGDEAAVVSRAAELLADTGGGGLASRLRAEVLLLRGRALWSLNELELASDDLGEAADRFDAEGQPARAAQARALQAFTRSGTLPELIAGHLEGWPRAVASGNTRVQIDIATNLAIDLSVVAGPDAERWRRTAESLLAPADHEGRAWLDLAHAYSSVSTWDFQRGADLAVRAHRVGTDSGSIQLRVQSALLIPEATIGAGDVDASRDWLTLLEGLFRQRATPRLGFYLHALRGELAARAGDSATARAQLAEAEARLASVPATDSRWFGGIRALTHLWLGEWEPASQAGLDSASAAFTHGETAIGVTGLLVELSVQVGQQPATAALTQLGPLLAHAPQSNAVGLAQRWAQQHTLLGGNSVGGLLGGPPAAATSIEQRALDLELAALTAGDPAPLLGAAELWDEVRLGVWAARARVWHAVATDQLLPPVGFSDELVSRWVTQWSARRR